MSRFVYFLRPLNYPGPIKIGCSRAPLTRLQQILTWSPVPLEIVVTIPGGVDLERRLHGMFKDAHSHMEWFHPSPSLLDLVEALTLGAEIGELIDLKAPILRFRAPVSRNWTPGYRVYLKYAARVRNAFERYVGPNNERWSPPHAVRDLLHRWGNVERDTFMPTPDQLRWLDDVIADPGHYGVTRLRPRLVAA